MYAGCIRNKNKVSHINHIIIWWLTPKFDHKNSPPPFPSIIHFLTNPTIPYFLALIA